MDDRWGQGPPAGADLMEQLVYLSNCVGEDPDLVQPGGGNSSIKMDQKNLFGRREVTLVVKGSGGDLRTIDAAGFSRLSMDRLSTLQSRGDISDEELMEFLGACMLYPRQDPLPSVETPLHSVLPHKVIIHTHDVAGLSLTNQPEAEARSLVAEVFADSLWYVPYARSGFPLARALMDLQPNLPSGLQGLALAHHGLVVWADDAATCYGRLRALVSRAQDYLAQHQPGSHVFGPAVRDTLSATQRGQKAAVLMPVIRGALGAGEKVILHLDDTDQTLDILSRESFPQRARRGVATPEHILRAGRLPLVLDLDLSASADDLADAARRHLATEREDYLHYHHEQAGRQEDPIDDWAKAVLIPGVGLVTAFRDKTSALVARDCYRAVMAVQAHADSVGSFQFLPDEEVHHFEHWPLERRKVTESMARERASQMLPRHISLILGGGSGIGEAAARRFAAQGAHVVVGDLDAGRAAAVAGEICRSHPNRAIGLGVDVCKEEQITAAVQRTVLEYGGLDSLFYTPGLAPRFAPLVDLKRGDLQAQLDINYLGALLSIQAAAAVMQRQGLGGAVVCSVSKAALAPGRQAAAYGGSKAGLLHALRIAALELGADGIRVNSINADQVETPLFLKFAGARAAARGVTLEEQLEGYRERNALRTSLIPADAVADLAVLLAGDLFRYTTGDIITIDGGLPDAFPR
jgi:rhamnose utilization protein RhaD (predicted bifunctional aldolase and dehydrogenase)/NAD(P)-dependent dehydrogenase (short-subunit alcohol dehydrogenase family)